MADLNEAQPAQVPIVDMGNQLLAETPAQLTLGPVDTTAGKRLMMTIRTPSTTQSVFLKRDDAILWAREIMREAQGMSGLIVGGVAPP